MTCTVANSFLDQTLRLVTEMIKHQATKEFMDKFTSYCSFDVFPFATPKRKLSAGQQDAYNKLLGTKLLFDILAEAVKLDEYEEIKSVFTAIHALPPSLPPPATPPIYVPKSKYVKNNLPAAIGHPTVLNLLLLPGDLDNPDVPTKVVADTLKCIEACDSLTYCHAQLFLAGHSMGKSKAIHDVAAKRFTVILDPSSVRQGQKDVIEMFSKIGHKVVDKARIPQNQLEDDCAYEVLLTFIARTVVLEYYLAVGLITGPTEWRNFQLNGVATEHYELYLLPIREYLRYKFPSYEQLKRFSKLLCKLHHLKHRERLVVAVDEANMLIQMHPDTFLDHEKTFPPNRPLWSLVGSTLAELLSVAMLIAGTRIRLRDEKILMTSSCKFGYSAGQILITRVNFR